MRYAASPSPFPCSYHYHYHYTPTPNPTPTPDQVAIVLSAIPIMSGAVAIEPEGSAGWMTDTIREHRYLALGRLALT